MVVEQGEGADLDAEDFCQYLQSLANTPAPMGEVLAGDAVFAAQKGSAHASAINMIVGRLVQVDLV